MNTAIIDLTTPQLWAVNSDHPNILAIAGPGSGKTRTLIERIRRLIRDGTSPSQIVAITFTNAAADEITHRLAAGEKPAPLGYVGTLHGFMLRLIQKNHAALGYASPRFSVLDEDATNELIDRCAAEMGYKGARKAVIEAGPHAVGHQRSLASLVRQKVDQTMKRHGLLSYDGILAEGKRLLPAEQLSQAEWVAWRKQNVHIPYTHLFVDEVQDLSDEQAEIVNSLPIPNRFMVGDPDQSVYAFNGGNVNHIMEFSRDPAAEVIWLEDNFRCDREICTVANELICHNEERLKETRPVSLEPGEINVRKFKNAGSELLDRLCMIRDMNGSTAVLLRSNVLVDAWKTALEEAGLPVAQRQTVTRPKNWSMVKTLLPALADPENDWLMFEAMKAVNEKTATQARTVALAAGSSLNQLGWKIPRNLPPSAYGATLARLGVSDESVEVVNRAAFGLPDGATGADLMAALIQEEKAGEIVGEGVTVSTIHSAKGREFDNVFLPAFEDQIIPGVAKSMNIEEERRLGYVAVTRARHKVFISYAGERTPAYGKRLPEPVNPSRFIKEMGL